MLTYLLYYFVILSYHSVIVMLHCGLLIFKM